MNARQTMVFGDNADDYRAFRPHYPDALFAWLASVAKQDRLAWDCGAGSGQAALGLSRHFTRVLATDPDPRQLALAPRRPMTIVWRAEDDLGPARRSISSLAPFDPLVRPAEILRKRARLAPGDHRGMNL
jgi:hypothetical protein